MVDISLLHQSLTNDVVMLFIITLLSYVIKVVFKPSMLEASLLARFAVTLLLNFLAFLSRKHPVMKMHILDIKDEGLVLKNKLRGKYVRKVLG